MFIVIAADPVKPVVTMTAATGSGYDILSSSTTNKSSGHVNNDVFSRLDDRSDGVFSRFKRSSLTKNDDHHGSDSNEMTSSFDTQQQQQPIATVINKRRIKLTDVKDYANSSPSIRVTSFHQPPANKIVSESIQCLAIITVWWEISLV